MATTPYRLIVAPVTDLADHLAALLLDAVMEGLTRPLGLATGRTMEPIYAALARRVSALAPAEQEALRLGWRSFNLDEYVGLGPAHPGSFAATMERLLIRPLALDPASVQLPDGLAIDPAMEAHRYGQALAAAGGLGLQVLGLGLNGHVGFNEPPCNPEAITRSVTLAEATLAQNASAFDGIGPLPEQAITVGLAEILAAQQLVLVVTGSAKATVLARALGEPPSADLPASWLQAHPGLLVLADPAAASALN
jgi:glucosamine-6-phosphate deaminase